MSVPADAPLAELDFGDLFVDDEKAALLPLVLKGLDLNGGGGEKTGPGPSKVVRVSASMAPSPDIECDVLFQAENENLKMALAGSGYYNELFNRTAIVEQVQRSWG